jgi:hypothetical protein
VTLPAGLATGEFPRAAARTNTRAAYLAIALAAAATVAWGFWPSYFGPLLRGVANRPSLIHLHAAVFVGWIVLLALQASLAASGRIALHRRIGGFGAAYGALLFCVGLVVSVGAPALRVRAGQQTTDAAAMVVLYNLNDIVLFGAFFAAAMACRERAAAHRRLVIAATVALSGAAVGRVLPGGTAIFALVWLAPLLACLAVDLAVEKRPSFVSLMSLAVFGVSFYKVQLLSLVPSARHAGLALLGVLL